MTQRTWAALVAVPLFVVLAVFASVNALPFVTFAPGSTINVLGENGGKPIITVDGHPTYRDDGELRMTTVSVTERDARLDLVQLMSTWFSRDDAVYPYAIQYGNSGSQQQDEHQGQVEMTGSQDAATAAALTQLGYHVAALHILKVAKGMPADGRIRVHDVVRRAGGTPISSPTQLVKIIQKVPSGESLPIVVERHGTPVTVRVTPVTQNGQKAIGVSVGTRYHFPFKVKVNINRLIGGPSAGLMFALSIYDTLTPGSLTSGGAVAGTGTIDGDGNVGEIGGIQQKIAGARQDGAGLFLVPPTNCPDALTSNHGSMRLAKATTLKQAISEVTAWGKDHDASLPQCSVGDGATS